MPTSHFTAFPSQVTIDKIPILNVYPQNIWWVNSAGANATDSGKGTKTNPFATIAYALTRAAGNDVILVKPGHTESLSTSLTMSTAGVTIVGMGYGARAPTLTATAAIDTVTMSASGTGIYNIRFAAPGIDDVTSDINVTGANCRIVNTTHIGSATAKNKTNIITLSSGANDAIIDGARIFNTVVEVGGGIVIAAAVSRGEICNCCVLDTIGFTNGAILDSAAGVQFYIHHNVFQNAKAATVVVNFVTNTSGIFSFNHVSGRHTTIASNVVTGNAMDFFETRVTEEPSKNGLISVPTVDVD